MKTRILILAAGETIVDGKFTTIEAIVQLQAAIERLRAMAAPTFDASWGEQPMPILGPSAAEVPQPPAPLPAPH